MMGTAALPWQTSNSSYDAVNGSDALASASSTKEAIMDNEVGTTTSRRGDFQKNIPGGVALATGLRRKSLEKIHGRSRQNSLRRVKNSTDMLRERSLQRKRSNRDVTPEATAGGREGRQFTVANVGIGGMIYLRSVAVRSISRMVPIKVPLRD